MDFICRTGSVLGYNHKMKGLNNQDYYVTASGQILRKNYLFGVVLDGCTGGDEGRNIRKITSKTEVGATLLGTFIKHEIPLILQADTPLLEIPEVLYQRCLGYLGQLARLTVFGPSDVMWDFIKRHLLCTVVGFIFALDEKKLLTFTAGDGVIIINDKIFVIDQQDKPLYLAYHLVDRGILGASFELLPKSFETVQYEDVNVDNFAICTDGIGPLCKDTAKNSWGDAPELMKNIWMYQPNASAGLQWFLNRELNFNHRFSDDCAVIEFHKEKGGEK